MLDFIKRFEVIIALLTIGLSVLLSGFIYQKLNPKEDINKQELIKKVESTNYIKKVIRATDDSNDICIISDSKDRKNISKFYRISKDEIGFFELIYLKTNKHETIAYEDTYSFKHTYKFNIVIYNIRTKKYTRRDIFPGLKNNLPYDGCRYDEHIKPEGFLKSSFAKDENGELYIKIPIYTMSFLYYDHTAQNDCILYNLRTKEFDNHAYECDPEKFMLLDGRRDEKSEFYYSAMDDINLLTLNTMDYSPFYRLARLNLDKDSCFFKMANNYCFIGEGTFGYGDVIMSLGACNGKCDENLMMFKKFPKLEKYVTDGSSIITFRLASAKNSDDLLKLFMNPGEQVSYDNMVLYNDEMAEKDPNTGRAEIAEYVDGIEVGCSVYGIEKKRDRYAHVSISNFDEYKKYSCNNLKDCMGPYIDYETIQEKLEKNTRESEDIFTCDKKQ